MRTSCCARTTRRWARSAARIARARSICSASRASSSSRPGAWAISGSTTATPSSPTRPRRRTNRMMADFCSVDRRFLGTAYIPLADATRTIETARDAIALGLKALLIPSRCPRGHSPSHIAFEPLWALAQEAGLPIVFHVGGEEKLPASYFENGLPRVKDFHGGEENFTSLSFMPIPNSVQITLAALIIDGVLDRHPQLKFGAIELGASWVPSWMRFMDSAAAAFIKNEPRLQKLSLKPSEFVQRQVRATPYPHEDVGWIIANSGEDISLFSS